MNESFLLEKNLLSPFYQKEVYSGIVLKKGTVYGKWKFFSSKSEKALCEHELEFNEILKWLKSNSEEKMNNKHFLHLQNICPECQSKFKINGFNGKRFLKLFNEDLVKELKIVETQSDETRLLKLLDISHFKKLNLNLFIKFMKKTFNSFTIKKEEDEEEDEEETLDNDFNMIKPEYLYILKLIPDVIQ